MQHVSENVRILSVKTDKEETRPMNQHPLPTPPQFYVSPLPENLLLKPGQYAVVPVTFLPRFPVGQNGDRFEVLTSISVETDHGRVTLPIKATSKRENDYNIPDTITLGSPGEKVHSSTKASANCETISLRATTDSMTILEVATIKAPYISLSNSAIHGKKHLVSWTSETMNMTPSKQPLTIPSDGDIHGFASICFHDSEVNDPTYEAPEDTWMFYGHYKSLGVLRVVTDNDTFYVQLEREYDNSKPVDLNEGLSSPEIKLKPIPEHLKIAFLHSDTYLVERTIRVYVPQGSRSMRMMRAATTLDSLEDDRTYGLDVEAQPYTSVDVEPMNLHDEIDGLVLDNAVNLQVSLDWCVLREKFEKENLVSKTFSGWVELSATTSDDDFETWSKKVSEDPNHDSHLKLIIPLETTIVLGRIGYEFHSSSAHSFRHLSAQEDWEGGGKSLSMLFFPASTSQIRSFAVPRGTNSSPEGLQSIEHKFHVYSNAVGSGIHVSQVRLLDSDGKYDFDMNPLCRCFKVSIVRLSGNYGDFARPNATDLAVIHLRYSGVDTTESLHVISNSICKLQVETIPDTGDHMLPLIIFPSKLHVSSSLLESNTSSSLDEFGRSIVVGYQHLSEWISKSPMVEALRKTIGGASHGKWSVEESRKLKDYLLSLNPKKNDIQTQQLRPILLDIGSMQHDQVERTSIYFTNLNPVPIKLSIDTGEVEGMAIALGRNEHAGNDAIGTAKPLTGDYLNGMSNGHAVEGVRQFLRSQKSSNAFFSRFPYQDSVGLSELATSEYQFLQELYASAAFCQLHSRPIPRRLLSDFNFTTCDSQLHPAEYGDLIASTSRKLQGPLILSDDLSLHRKLNVCWGSEQMAMSNVVEESTVVPPGGVARYDVILRTPQARVIKGDIAHFLATGLVLSSDLGEVFPVLASFKALKGGLELSPLKDQKGEDRRNVPVPTQLFSESLFGERENALSLDIPPGTLLEDMVPLALRSTFTDRVDVLDVSSCNPLFQVGLSNDTSGVQSQKQVQMIQVSSAVDCNTYDSFTLFPSFYRCLQAWLTQRRQLQQKGCDRGVVDHSENRLEPVQNSSDDFEKAADSMARAKTIVESLSAIRSNLLTHESKIRASYKSGRPRGNGIVSSHMLDAVVEGLGALSTFSELGVLSMSSVLRASVDYRSTVGGTSRLEVTLKNLTVTSTIRVPTLFDEERARQNGISFQAGSYTMPPVLQFETVITGGTSLLYLPVRNPTASLVRVRLGASDHFTNSRASFIGDSQSPYIQGKPGLASNTAVGHSWWENGSSFFLRGRRGGTVLTKQKARVIPSDTSGSEMSLITPGMGTINMFTKGCGFPCGIRDRSVQPVVSGLYCPVIGASAARGQSLSNRARSFSLPSQEGKEVKPEITTDPNAVPPPAFAMPVGALDEIVVGPLGEGLLGPIYFRPSQARPGRDSDASASFDSYVFLENSLTGLERVFLKGRSLREEIVFDDVQARDSDAFSDVELRNGFSALLFNDESHRGFSVKKKLYIRNDGDVTTSFRGVRVSNGKLPSSFPYSTNCHYGEFQVANCEDLSRNFTLDPGDFKEVFVEFHPSCRLSKSFVAIDFHGQQTFKRQVRMLVGYDHQSKNCRAVKKRRQDYGQPKVKGLSVLMCLTIAAGMGAVFVLFGGLVSTRLGYSQRFRLHLSPIDPHSPNRVMNLGWYPTFRCLARNDPISTDLQALGREQSRHVVLARYRLSGVLPPVCVTSTGVFQRDSYDSNRGQKKSRASERSKILSDIVFRTFTRQCYGRVMLPCGIRWQAVVARGVSTLTVLAELRSRSFSESLLTRRKMMLASEDMQDASSSELEDEDGDDEFSRKEEESENNEIVSIESSKNEKADAASLASMSLKADEPEFETVTESSSSLPDRTPAPAPADETTTSSTRKTFEEKRTTSVEYISVKTADPAREASVRKPRKKKKFHQLKSSQTSDVQRESSANSTLSRTEKVSPMKDQRVEKPDPIPERMSEISPPPGFGSIGAETSQDGKNSFGITTMEPDPITSLRVSDRNIPLFERSFSETSLSIDAIEHPQDILHGTQSEPVPSDQIFVPSVHQASSQDDHSSPGEFDIMDFLDDILNDREKQNEQAAENTIEALSQSTGSLPAVSANPWAVDNLGGPRALAYGIEIESTSQTPANHQLQIPLLTTADILASEEEETGPRVSFYTSLLGG